MTKKPANPNAKAALNQMKLEIANELGVPSNNMYGSNKSAYENGVLGGRVGGQMSKRLVEMGQEQLIKQYNSKNR
ncbi:alpha/beta-type small acid-soluble spore protein [Romboutsia sp.]|uniref:alpha/beta-type small acid-soluble spore protein n=1 Tax=Romboutsia sp. TaxID=1965302 RepID=UPI002B9F33FE|nr:alpha/beta-type small acid-soluble spore protein [Romboutsia sp.]HSQ87418.1 alpha/beta-type small acid-soluble spore protein [Romboutsia sp.]